MLRFLVCHLSLAAELRMLDSSEPITMGVGLIGVICGVVLCLADVRTFTDRLVGFDRNSAIEADDRTSSHGPDGFLCWENNSIPSDAHTR